MQLKSLKALIKRGESDTLELKETTGRLTDAMRTLCAFLNQERGDGGTVLFGVTDKGKIIGQEVSDKTKRDIAHAIDQIEPHADVKVDYTSLGSGKFVVALIVKEGKDKPYRYDGRSYERRQSTTRVMSQEKYEHLLHSSNRPSLNWESLTSHKCTINDLDKKRIKDVVRLAILRGRLPDQATDESIDEILHHFELLNEKRLTNAAVTLFCKSEQKQFIQSAVQLARFQGTDKRVFLDRKDLRGNIFDLFEGVMKFLQFSLPISGEIVEGNPYRVDRPVIPYKALREALLNAFTHRDYSMYGATIEIAIYDDRLEIDSPGCLPEGIEVRLLKQKHRSIRRNPLIANVLYATGLIERWGRGTLDMIELCKESGNPVPKFDETSGSFSVTFQFKEPLRRPAENQTKHQVLYETLTTRQKEIVAILKHGPMSRDQIMNEMKHAPSIRTLQEHLTNLKNLGVIIQEGKGRGRFVIWTIRK